MESYNSGKSKPKFYKTDFGEFSPKKIKSLHKIPSLKKRVSSKKELIGEALNTPLPAKPEENIKQMQKKFKRKKNLLKRNKSLP